MTFDIRVVNHIKKVVRAFLDELKYEYYIDAVLAIVHPHKLTMVLNNKHPDEVKKELIYNGFTCINNKDCLDCPHFTMSYKEIINIIILNDTTIAKTSTLYEVMKKNNRRVSSISLKHVVMDMLKEGFSIHGSDGIYVKLSSMTSIK